MQKFCPKCGADVEQVFGSNGLCRDCFTEEHDLVELPDEITFRQCRVCGSYLVGHSWNEFESDEKLVYDLLEKYEEEEVEMSASFRQRGEVYLVNVLMRQTINGEEIEQTHEIRMEPEKTQCDKCSRHQGGYYEVILQLRGLSEDAFGELMDTASGVTEQDRTDFIANVEERDGGYDVYASSRKMAEKLLQELREHFSVEEERSKELVGEEDGERVYRTVIAAHVGEQLH
ncbi:MAG: 60S ribosomal export protein NMD3 [Candidatus Nanohaloarchaea archaeon]|nr:60S ribosomal export protein NMD3 [Candidatus Nanohaloarchaea archaeon]